MRPRLSRRSLLLAAAAAGLGALPVARAQPAPGRDYRVVDPALPTDSGDRIEVLEFFWYGCVHCFNLEPALEAWSAKLGTDVVLKRVPAVFNDRWAHDATIFYALEAIGAAERTHRALFEAIHVKRLNTTNERLFTEWLKSQGIDDAAFGEAFRSFGVSSRVLRAVQLTAAYRVDGTPSLAIGGRYAVSADQAATGRAMLATADHLIDLVRRSRPAR